MRVIKFLSLFILPCLVVILTFFYIKTQESSITTVGGEKILTIPYQNTTYESFGLIYTPTVTLPVKTADSFKNYNFLVDTGAVVSALPAKESSVLGINLAFLPRIAVEGYGGQTSFTYQGSITVKIMEDIVILPCVFSEVDEYNYILGRKGLVENYTITFNSQKRAV